MSDGRGAWSTRGKPNSEKLYRVVHGELRDGETPDGEYTAVELEWFNCVRLGVTAIQLRLIDEEMADGTHSMTMGRYGNRTVKAVRRFQADRGITADGIVGSQTMSSLLRPVILKEAEAKDIAPKWIYGLARQESALDPGAQGWDTPFDRGIWQFNTAAGPLSPETAADISLAGEAVCRRWAAARETYRGKGEQLRVDCCIIQHRSPAAADHLYATGTPYGPESAKYVTNVRTFAEEWA